MNHVTFETAVNLKKTGFPQPETTTFGECFFVTRITGRHVEVVVDRMAAGQPVTDDYVFAPTATDIMRVLPGLSLRWHSVRNKWQCRYKKDLQRHEHDNPAEACAAVWLVI